VAQIASVREQAAADAAKLPAGDPLRSQLRQFDERADAVRKVVVATTEGGAITGEVRLREKADEVYGAIISTDGPPTAYAVERIGTLDRELADAEKNFATFTGSELPQLNEKLKAKSLAPLAVPASPQLSTAATGGVAGAFEGTLGTHYRGSFASSAAKTDDR
jgi:hypothetical protein